MSALLSRLLTRSECKELSELLEAKCLKNLDPLSPLRAVGTADAGSPLQEKPGLYREQHDTEPCPPPDPDSWDLSSEELCETADLRERFYYGDRGAYDPFDDKADIQPFERLTDHRR